ncbi:polysaccharide biosynthesis/export family protein [Vibrio sp. RC27]
MKKISTFLSCIFTLMTIAASPSYAADFVDDQKSPATTHSLNISPNQSLESGDYASENKSNLLLPAEVDMRELLPSSGEQFPPPYGANLFAGGVEAERVDGLNDNYLIASGDKINIWLWGAVNFSEVLTVDTQGNIFIPNIGPVYVADIRANEVNALVTSKIKEIYTNVSVYVNLLTATAVNVYISGPVIRPGQYAGMASSSVLYFLKRAGGIDSERGSYREIEVKRRGRVIATVDLYEFIRLGVMPVINFKDGDVILVKPQKAAITVAGGVRNPFRFEFKDTEAKGQQLIDYARPLAKVSHVGIVGDRASGPFSEYIQYSTFKDFILQDGDKVVFNDDQRVQVVDVQISGSYQGPSFFSVKNTTRLFDVLSYVPIDRDLADINAIYILRKSVAERQKEMIEETLERLERSVLTTSVASGDEAEIRVKEAQLIMQFTDRARSIEPLGKVIVSEDGNLANIMLEQGDQIVIPPKSDLVQISGEVLMPQAVVFNPEAKIDDYVAWAGGFTERAEDSRIAVIRSNGMVVIDKQVNIRKGDEILVLPKTDTKILQAVKDITQVIYQIAIAANVVLLD